MNQARLRLAQLVTNFFSRYLAAELDASSHTIASYRDAFRLFLCYLAGSTGRPVARLILSDLSAEAILAFLENLERKRGNSVPTRNARLAALRSFFSYAVTQDATVAAQAQKVLAIPFKKSLGHVLDYLSEYELRAILRGPDRSTVRGRRDYLALALLYDTAARVQELVDLCPAHFRLHRLPLVKILGKGRKQRIVPLLPATAKLVRDHLGETGRQETDSKPLLRNYQGEVISRSGMRYLLDKYRRHAADRVPTLRRKGISPHIFRHTKAMHLLQAGVSPVTIKDILGHAHLKTIETYVQADLEMKRRALASTRSPVEKGPIIYRTEPDLLQWLEQL